MKRPSGAPLKAKPHGSGTPLTMFMLPAISGIPLRGNKRSTAQYYQTARHSFHKTAQLPKLRRNGAEAPVDSLDTHVCCTLIGCLARQQTRRCRQSTPQAHVIVLLCGCWAQALKAQLHRTQPAGEPQNVAQTLNLLTVAIIDNISCSVFLVSDTSLATSLTL